MVATLILYVSKDESLEIQLGSGSKKPSFVTQWWGSKP